MATAPTPIDFTQYEWALGDTTRMITQWNAMQAALTQYGQDLVPFGDQMTTEMNATIEARQAAEAARDQAQEIAVGDVAVTDLQPGALTSPMDYPSVDAQGGLVKRNVQADIASRLASGEESASLTRYDLASVATTATLDLAASNVFRVDASSPVTLAFANTPGAGRAMTVVVHITGNSAVTWPTGITWDAQEAPTLGDAFTRVVLIWDGVEWTGYAGAAR